MDDKLQAAVKTIQDRFDAEVQEFRGEITLFIKPQQVVDITRALKDEFKFEMLVDATAVDYWPQETPRFHVIYHLYSFSDNLLLRLRMALDGKAAQIKSVAEVYANANWKEREIWDLFGIHIEGHPDLRRIMMPEDWVGHPLRKDYPLGYEEVQFSFNVDEINSRKPYAKGLRGEQ